MGVSSTAPSAIFPGKTRKIQVFNASGTWVRPVGVDLVDIFVVAGGGGGGSVSSTGEQAGSGSAGGGAGGQVIDKENVPVTGNVSVVVGAGGAAQPIGVGAASPSQGGTGGSSSFGSFTALGGGPGEGFAYGNYDSQLYRATLPFAQGVGGGVMNNSSVYLPACGGAGAGGHSPTVNPAGSTSGFQPRCDGDAHNGAVFSSGLAVNYATSPAPPNNIRGIGGPGVKQYGAGGGGGSSNGTPDATNAIPGGSPWAGAGGWASGGGVNRPGGAATANTGCGGGGAARGAAAGVQGGAGASGVVIVAWWE